MLNQDTRLFENNFSSVSITKHICKVFELVHLRLPALLIPNALAGGVEVILVFVAIESLRTFSFDVPGATAGFAGH